MSASILAVVSQGSVHVDMEAVWALVEAVNVAWDYDGGTGMFLLQEELSVHPAAATGHKVHSGQDGLGLFVLLQDIFPILGVFLTTCYSFNCVHAL